MSSALTTVGGPARLNVLIATSHSPAYLLGGTKSEPPRLTVEKNSRLAPSLSSKNHDMSAVVPCFSAIGVPDIGLATGLASFAHWTLIIQNPIPNFADVNLCIALPADCDNNVMT